MAQGRAKRRPGLRTENENLSFFSIRFGGLPACQTGLEKRETVCVRHPRAALAELGCPRLVCCCPFRAPERRTRSLIGRGGRVLSVFWSRLARRQWERSFAVTEISPVMKKFSWFAAK